MDFIQNQPSTNHNPLLHLQNISKSFGEVQVLKSIELKGNVGEIIALVGENGAGKSTLVKILSGVWPKESFSGTISIDGNACDFYSVKEAQSRGIAIIHQELQLVPELTIAENIFLGKEPHRFRFIQWEKLYENTEQLLKMLDISLDPLTKIKDLNIGEKQLVEIAKALRSDIRILVLDEPTSALTQKEIRTLFSLLQKLKKQHVLCIYISHKLEEVFAIADRILVLRDGELISDHAAKDTSQEKVIEDMVGRKLSQLYPSRTPQFGEEVLKVSLLSCRQKIPKKKNQPLLNQISFSVRQGEILGFSGLMGSGRSELIHTLFGATSFEVEGDIYLNNQKVYFSSPRDAIRAGLALLTEDRKYSGMIPQQSVQTNMTLAALKSLSTQKIIHATEEKKQVHFFINQFKIKTASLETEIHKLSGGNQQKVLLAKWLLTLPKVLLLDEPTRGVDVGSKTEIYALINELSQKGVAIILVSSDLPEVLNLSNRVAVLNSGSLMGILSKEEATPEKVMFLATAPFELGQDA